MRVQTLIVILVLVAVGYFGAVGVMEWMDRPKQQPSVPVAPSGKAAASPASGKELSPIRLTLISAERFQKFNSWAEAAEKYREAQKTLDLNEADSEIIRKKLDAVESLMYAEKLIEDKRWDEAIVAYGAAADEIENKAYVERAIARAKTQKQIAVEYARAEKLVNEGKLAEAQGIFREVYKIARNADLPTDALDRAKRLEADSKSSAGSQDRMLRALDTCASAGDLYAVVGACRYFEKDPAYGGLKETCAARKKEALDAMSGRKAEFPSLRAGEEMEFVRLRQGDGSVVEGSIEGEEGSKLRLMVLQGLRIVPKTVVKGSGGKIERAKMSAEGVNEARAQQLFTEVVRSVDRQEYVAALAAAGALEREFAETQAASNVACQQRLTGSVSPRVAAMVGRTLQDLLACAVEGLRQRCLTCSGTGIVTCTTCNGTGRVQLKCLMCGGRGRMPCGRCGGTKRMLINGKMITCPYCKGTGDCKCVPCEGKGEVSQGCQYCDANHMMICPDCGGTKRAGTRVYAVSAGEALAPTDSPERKKAHMQWLFDICTSRQNYYGMYAAARYYEKQKDYKAFADLITARIEEARAGLEDSGAGKVSGESSKALQDVIKTTDGKTFRGKIVEETESAVTMSVNDAGKSVKRIVLRKSISSTEKAPADHEDAQNERGDALVTRAAQLLGRSRDLEALSAIGALLYSSPGAEIVTDTAKQKKAIIQGSPEVFTTVGGTLDALTGAIVKRVESICVECEGKCTFTCSACKGTGTREIPCKWCRGSKRIFCDTCGGSGREVFGPGDERPCRKCGGSGWMNCHYCKQKGTQVDRCDKCKGAGMVNCPKCGGKGRMDLSEAVK